MKCYECGTEMVARSATREKAYAYKLSGLQNVFLCGITVHRCLKCKSETPVIPKIEELHCVIARSIIREPTPLRGDEVRFLRKHAGFPAKKFAALLGIRPEHLSRIENEPEKSLGAPTDRLARVLVMTVDDQEDAREFLLKIADKLEARKARVKTKPPLFKLDKNHWQLAA